MAVPMKERLHVTVTGEGARTVVLGHGFGTDQRAWRHQVEALRGRCRLVLFNHLGLSGDFAGYSSREYSCMERWRDDLLALGSELGLQGACYVGHSAGACIGMLASLERPALFDKLIVIGASPHYLDEPGYRGGFSRQDLDALYDAMATDYIGWANGFAPIVMRNADRPSLGEAFARTLKALRPDIAQSVARVIFEVDYRAVFPRLRTPLLVLQALRDIAVPVEVGDWFVRNVPGARLQVLDAEGHHPYLSAPEQVNAAILQELASEPARG
jgi:sigma-B regulation protein RsbQ